MLSPDSEEALASLMRMLTAQPELEERVFERWRSRGQPASDGSRLPPDAQRAADRLAAAFLELAQPARNVAPLAEHFGGPSAPVVLLWCYASTWRREIELSRVLALAAERDELRERVAAVAASRVLEGPLLDALRCAPLIGDGDALALPQNSEARSRLEILIW